MLALVAAVAVPVPVLVQVQGLVLVLVQLPRRLAQDRRTLKLLSCRCWDDVHTCACCVQVSPLSKHNVTSLDTVCTSSVFRCSPDT